MVVRTSPLSARRSSRPVKLELPLRLQNDSVPPRASRFSAKLEPEHPAAESGSRMIPPAVDQEWPVRLFMRLSPHPEGDPGPITKSSVATLPVGDVEFG